MNFLHSVKLELHAYCADLFKVVFTTTIDMFLFCLFFPQPISVSVKCKLNNQFL